MRKMPIGIQSFEELRRNNLVYVDKTALVYQLAQDISPHFLARPRRFGKSLLISTLEAYFKGKRELFDGLALAELEQDWQEYPVFHIDLTGINYQEPGDIELALNESLIAYEEQWNPASDTTNVSLRFFNLIRAAAEQSGKGVVVLIDEYDKPLLESLDDIELNTCYRDALRAFYGVLKKASQYLRFTLLTGVTKFSQVSVFSDLNQLRDISLEDEYSALCGITETELVATFEPELQALAEKNRLTYDEALAKMKQLYDGYHFSKQSPDIYNPFSVINTFAKLDYGFYWFKTGTPTFLLKLIAQSNFDIMEFQAGVEIGVNAIDDFRIGSTNPVPVLYQSGYLTIKSYDEVFSSFILGFPNEEVQYGFLEALLPVFFDHQMSTDFDVRQFAKDLLAPDIEAFFTRLKALFASVPYGSDQKSEHYYQSIFYIIFTLMGQYIKAEEHTYKGRSDAVVETKDAVFIFEFKLATGEGEATINAALEQIERTGYAERYAASAKQLHKIAVQFDPEARNITNYKVWDRGTGHLSHTPAFGAASPLQS